MTRKNSFIKRAIALLLCMLMASALISCNADNNSNSQTENGGENTDSNNKGGGSIKDYGHMNEDEWDENK